MEVNLINYMHIIDDVLPKNTLTTWTKIVKDNFKKFEDATIVNGNNPILNKNIRDVKNWYLGAPKTMTEFHWSNFLFHVFQKCLSDYIKTKNNITLACLDGVTDPRNIGSIIRSSASFQIDGIIVKERQFPNDSKLMYKAASGAIEYVNIFEVANINSTLKNLKEKNFWVYGFDGKGKKDFTDIDWKGNNILLFGSEGFGMHQHTSKYADFLVKINIDNKIESLNISNSASIVFHHLSYLKKTVD